MIWILLYKYIIVDKETISYLDEYKLINFT